MIRKRLFTQIMIGAFIGAMNVINEFKLDEFRYWIFTFSSIILLNVIHDKCKN